MGQNLADTEITAAEGVTDSATGWADKVIAVLARLKSGNNPLGSAALRGVDTTEESGATRQLMPLDSAGKAPTGHLRAAAPGQAGVIPAIRSGDIAGTTPGAGTADKAVATDTGGRLPAKFLPAATTAASGVVRLAAAGETTGDDVVTASAMAGVPQWTKVSSGDYWQQLTTDDVGTLFNLSADILEASNHFLAFEVRVASSAVLPLIWIPRDRIHEARPQPTSWDGNVYLYSSNSPSLVQVQTGSGEGGPIYETRIQQNVTAYTLKMWMPTARQLRVQATAGDFRIRTIWRVSGIPS